MFGLLCLVYLRVGHKKSVCDWRTVDVVSEFSFLLLSSSFHFFFGGAGIRGSEDGKAVDWGC